MRKPELSLELLTTFLKCKNEPEKVCEQDIDIIVKYSLGMDQVQLADFIKELGSYGDSIVNSVVEDARIIEYLARLTKTENQLGTAKLLWGKRKSGVN